MLVDIDVRVGVPPRSADLWTRRLSCRRSPTAASPWPKRTSGRMRSPSAAGTRPRGRAAAAAPAAAAGGPGRRRAGRRCRGSTPISFGGSGPERAKVKKTATITAPAAKITRPEWARPPTIASRRVAGCVPVLLGARRAGRRCSPSRSRRSSRRRRPAPRRRGSPAIRSRAGRRGGRPGRSAWRRRRRRRSRAGW